MFSSGFPAGPSYKQPQHNVETQSQGARDRAQTWKVMLAAQFLPLLLLCAGGGAARRSGTESCLSPEELQDPGLELRKLLGRANTGRLPALDLVKALERRRREPGTCPQSGLRPPGNADLGHRSISPWEYRVDYDVERYPAKLAFARCLCAGCIDAETGEETLALNSVALVQRQLVLRRRPCPGQAGRFRFQMEYMMVPVGFTCVLPQRRL